MRAPCIFQGPPLLFVNIVEEKQVFLCFSLGFPADHLINNLQRGFPWSANGKKPHTQVPMVAKATFTSQRPSVDRIARGGLSPNQQNISSTNKRRKQDLLEQATKLLQCWFAAQADGKIQNGNGVLRFGLQQPRNAFCTLVPCANRLPRRVAPDGGKKTHFKTDHHPPLPPLHPPLPRKGTSIWKRLEGFGATSEWAIPETAHSTSRTFPELQIRPVHDPLAMRLLLEVPKQMRCFLGGTAVQRQTLHRSFSTQIKHSEAHRPQPV